MKNAKIICTDDEEVIKIYRLSEEMILIRPDGYIALITSDSNEVGQYFKRFR